MKNANDQNFLIFVGGLDKGLYSRLNWILGLYKNYINYYILKQIIIL